MSEHAATDPSGVTLVIATTQRLTGPSHVPLPVGLSVEVERLALRAERPLRRRLVFLGHYLIVLVAAEALLAVAEVPEQATLVVVGILLDVYLLVSLPIEAAWLATKDRPLAAFLGALVLPPILRVVSLSTPLSPFTMVQWLAIVSVPLLLACFAVMRALELRPQDVFVGLGDRRLIGLNVAVAASGLGLGYGEYRLLHVAPWLTTRGAGDFAFAAFAIFLATGLAEELIFRGILLSTGVKLLGRRGALLYVAVVFASLHIGFLSVPYVLVAFAVGLAFGLVVLVTKTLWGTVVAHTLANVALYLVFPFGL